MSGDAAIAQALAEAEAALASASTGFAGKDTTLATAFTAYGAAALCGVFGYLARGRDHPSGHVFKWFFASTGLGFGMLGASTQILNSLAEGGDFPGMALGDTNSLYLYFYMIGAVFVFGAAAMMVAVHMLTNDRETSLVTMTMWLLGLGGVACGVLGVVMSDDPIIIAERELGHTARVHFPFVLSALAFLEAIVNKIRGKALPGVNMLILASLIYAGAFALLLWGVEEACATAEGCPWPVDFNENAIHNCGIILAIILVHLAAKGAHAGYEEEEGNAAVVIALPEDDSKASASDSSSNSD